ncbi:MAG: helix-turn-helix domain-containing protein [Thermodesulfobacteria bacterium]|nr:helix-turn-helix domain-containing protein [Thermodesulfobacteriota bacterium]
MEPSLPQTVRLDSEKIRRIREERGLTQLYVATVVGVTIDTISRWENKRYPSVKRENALKLAETLEVDVQEILEQPDDSKQDESTSKEEQPKEKTQPPEDKEPKEEADKGGRNILLILLWAIGLLGAGILAGYLIFKPSPFSLEVNAARFLPAYCAKGSLFPVLIRIDISPEDKRTVLIKEDIPRTLKITKAVPPYTSLEKGLLKWIYQGQTTNLKFVYIARMPQSIKEYKTLRFRGTVTIKTNQTVSVTIGGNSQITAAPFNWADKNGDNRIDDEEILDAYELLSGVKGMSSLLKEVETLWAAGQYRWDERAKRFVPEKIAHE